MSLVGAIRAASTNCHMLIALAAGGAYQRAAEGKSLRLNASKPAVLLHGHWRSKLNYIITSKYDSSTRLRTAGMKLRFFFLLFSAVSPSQLLLCILVVQLYSYVQQLAVQLAAYS